jgi:hypothetical protein
MSSIRPPAEEAALVEALGEAAKHRGVQLGVGPWRDVADLLMTRVIATGRGKAAQAVLRAKPAAERAAIGQKRWATRRAKAAAAQLAELEAEAL